MITEAQIRSKLYAYLARQLSLNEFEDWLVQHSWNMHLDSSRSAQALAGAVELRLAEYSQAHLTDDALDREFSGLLARPLVARIGEAALPEPEWEGTSTIAENSVLALTFEAS